MVTAQMGGMAGSQALFVMDVLHINLDEGEGLLRFPRPKGRIKALAALELASVAVAAQDMANRMWGKLHPTPLKTDCQPMSAQARLLGGLQHQFLNLFWGLARGMVGAAGVVVQSLIFLSFIPPHPAAHHLARGMPEACRGADAAGILVCFHKLFIGGAPPFVKIASTNLVTISWRKNICYLPFFRKYVIICAVCGQKQ
jgi:hypothetical protein